MRPAFTGVALAFSVLCLSSSSIMVRLSSAPVLIIALYRLLFTAGFAFWLRRGFKEPAPVWRRALLRDILLAGVFLALHFVFWFTSLRYTSVSSSVLFTNQQVIFVLLFSCVVLREKLPPKALGGIALALGGCVAVAGGDLFAGGLWGDFLALISGFCVAVYFILGRLIRREVDTWTYTLLVSAMAAAALIPAAGLSGAAWWNYPLSDWLLFVFLALLPGIAGHGILNWSLKYLPAPLVALSILGETVGASLLALLFFTEGLDGYQLLGGGMILGGIYLAMTHTAPA
jgi:drug/metabolite transporter (DMT)-like permease